ncbi:MAG: glycosyltransferase family 1 protein [Geobacter sp.]|nr:MAG: glycosyltransferase family 1 protein [Geobacter sp.]
MLAPTPYFADRGCHVRIYEEARSLMAAGHKVRIVTYHLGRDMPGIPVTRIPTIPWYNKLEAGPSWHKIYLDALLLFKAVPLILEFRPHIIHAHLHEGAFIGYILKKMFRLPLIFDYQGSLTGECIDHGFFTASSFAARVFKRIENMINNFADKIVTSSGSANTELTNGWGVPPEKVAPIIDGVDTDVFRPLPQDECRERAAIPKDVPVVAYLGVLSRYQGTDLLLDCIETLREMNVSAHFLIMGFPCEQYRAEAEARGLSEAITFTGKIDYKDAPTMLSAADIAVAPKLSLTEANGKLFNYMACGLPVIAFDTPVNREVLGDTGIYARYADSGDMAKMIAALLSDHEARRQYSVDIREKAVNEHSWKSRSEKLVELYQDIVKAGELTSHGKNHTKKH